MFIVTGVLAVLGYVVWQIIKPYVHSILMCTFFAVISMTVASIGILVLVVRHEGGFAMAWTGDSRGATSPTSEPTRKLPVLAPEAPEPASLPPVPVRAIEPPRRVPASVIDAELERLAQELAHNDVIQQGRLLCARHSATATSASARREWGTFT